MSDEHPLHLCGWAGPAVAEAAWDRIGHLFKQFMIVGAVADTPPGKRYALYEFVRKVLGRDTLNYAQQVGDCVSFGAKNAIEYVSCVEASQGRGEYHRVFPPWLYGSGRVFIGQGEMGSSDGSVGSWQAKAVEQYGVLRAEFSGVPEYSGTVARQWGAPPGPPQTFMSEAKVHLVRTTAPVHTWYDLYAALSNGYAVTIASNQGFEMLPRSDGFHYPKGSWGHQMCITLIDDAPQDPYAGILNSWGDVHGSLKDFVTGATWPVGMLRVRRATIEHMLTTGEAFAYSQFDGFPAQTLDWVSVV